MYGLNEIVAMNFGSLQSHKDRVCSDHLSDYNSWICKWAAEFAPMPHTQITHGEWEARQQKECQHESASNE